MTDKKTAATEKSKDSTVELKKITTLDVYGKKKLSIDGSFTAEELGELLVDNWVSYVECHQCPKVDTCKYPEPHSHNELKKAEIVCGVHSDFIKNFVNLSFDILKGSDTKEQTYVRRQLTCPVRRQLS